MPSRIRFTLRDLIAVIVMLTVVAAFAVPAFTRSRIAANETMAVASLKQLVSSESSWRQLDMDGNLKQDYWTLDVAGFYGMQDPTGAARKLIDIDFARADACRRVSFPGMPSANRAPCRPIARHGYLFQAMLYDDGAGTPTAYCANYVPTQPQRDILRNRSGAAGYATATNSHFFGFCATPKEYPITSVRTHIVNEMGVIFDIDLGCSAFQATWPGTEPMYDRRTGHYWKTRP